MRKIFESLYKQFDVDTTDWNWIQLFVGKDYLGFIPAGILLLIIILRYIA